MQTIDIDFDVFRTLTSMRREESVTYNDVLRSILNLTDIPKTQVSAGEPWMRSNTSLPSGTKLFGEHKDKKHSAEIRNGKIVFANGKEFKSPSMAAVHITGYNTNGWRFWKAQLPGSSEPVLLERLRGKRH